MKSTQKFPCVLWREVVELLGKLTDHGKAEDCRADPKPGLNGSQGKAAGLQHRQDQDWGQSVGLGCWRFGNNTRDKTGTLTSYSLLQQGRNERRA